MKILRCAALLIAAVMTTGLHAIDHDARARELVGKMTLDEKISLLAGETPFSIRAIPRLGIPQVLLADGPQGVRNQTPHSTLYPCGVLTAATWDRDIARRVGESLGDDARARGIGIMLGPGVNIYRSPLSGRGFEYFGEDPYLAGETTSEYIRGMQSRGVSATVKHFAANNQEWDRHHASSDVDERTLHEIYFPAFRKAVEAGVGAVMNSYNPLNGVHATENDWLNNHVLKRQWGFDGILMSDWTSVYSTVGAANGGLDLEMPSPVWFTPEKLKAAIDAGRVSMATIDDKVVRLLRTYSRFGWLDGSMTDPNIPLDCPTSAQTALDAARGGIVLLKNEDNQLPLKGRTLIVGPYADRITTGGGSGFVSPFHSTSLADAMKQAHRNTVVLSDKDLYHNIAAEEVWTDATRSTRGFKGEYFSNRNLEGKPTMTRIDQTIDFDWGHSAPTEGMPADNFSARWTGWLAPSAEPRNLRLTAGGDDGFRVYLDSKLLFDVWNDHSYISRNYDLQIEPGKAMDLCIEYYENISEAKVDFALLSFDDSSLDKELRRADNVVVCTGFDSGTESEGFDRTFAMAQDKVDFIKRVAAVNPNVTVVLNAGGGVEMESWQDDAKAIVMAWYSGQEGGTALTEILTGKLSPSGRLPISIERKESDNPSAPHYHAASAPDNEARRIDYAEGIFCGYRGYDRSGVKPLYPFGYGLSYTTFDYSNLKLSPAEGNTVNVEFDIKNTGRMAAAEVAQVYVTDNECSVPRPVKELKGYEKVYLKPGETRHVSVVLDPWAFAFYDIDRSSFTIEPGVFTVSVGPNSADLPLSAEVKL